MASIDTNAFLFAPAGSRRKSSRINTSGALHAFVVALNNFPVEIRNLSYGGFATAAARTFSTGTTYQFRFVTPEGVSTVLRASVVHCYAVREADSRPYDVTGWEFVRRASEDTDARIGRLMDSIATELVED